MVPADGNFTTAIQKGNHKAGEVQGQTRQHARLINLLGVKQLIVGVNKMDCDTAGYKESRYEEIANEMKNMLIKVGWKKDYVEKCVPVLPISGWIGDNLIKKTENMAWWKGMDVIDYNLKGDKFHIDTLLDVLNNMVNKPEGPTLPCASPSPASTRSRVSVMSSWAASSRAPSAPVRRLSSSPRTPSPTPAPARCSLSRCTTSASRGSPR